MSKSKLSPNQIKILELRAKIAKHDAKIKKAKEIHDRKLKIYESEKAYIDSLEGDARIDATLKSIARLIEDIDIKDIDEYIRKGSTH
ncbi:MAG: hypothetical protein JSR17_13495 [Proteobacteria bacterium]|nr:hypothetical protein [Pseudomonadota bacterium]